MKATLTIDGVTFEVEIKKSFVPHTGSFLEDIIKMKLSKDILEHFKAKIIYTEQKNA